MTVYTLRICTAQKPSPWGEGGFKISLQEILKTDVGKILRIRRTQIVIWDFSAPHISQKSNRFLTASPQGEAFGCGSHRKINDHLPQTSEINVCKQSVFLLENNYKPCYTDSVDLSP